MITNIQSIIGKVQKLRSFRENREQNLITGVDKKGLCLRIITWGEKKLFTLQLYHAEIKSRHTRRNQRNILLNRGNCYLIKHFNTSRDNG